MAVNVALLTKVMEHIENHPQEHRQDVWAIREPCGTAYCFAGHTVVIAGWTPVIETDGEGVKCVKNDGEKYSIPSIAMMELWLDEQTAGGLFHFENSATDLRRIVNQIIDREQ